MQLQKLQTRYVQVCMQLQKLQKKLKFYLVKCSSNPYLKMPGLWVQEDSGTGTGKGGYITAILRGTLLFSDKWAVWLICYNSKDLYSRSIHQSWLPHLISLRSWKQQGVWTIQRFIFFLFLVTKSYTLFMNIILCYWHVSWHLLTDMVVMLTNINCYFKWGFILVNLLTWQTANMLA